MKRFHVTLDNTVIDLSSFDAKEKRAALRLFKKFDSNPSWHDFSNFFPKVVNEAYVGRPATAVVGTPLWQLGQDLDSRLGVEQGCVSLGDYRDEIAALIWNKFKTQRAFCKATGLSEDMVSHVLARRKHLSMETLEDALKKIGYRLTIRSDADFGFRPQSRKQSRGKTG